jgi:hypothetical protein
MRFRSRREEFRLLLVPVLIRGWWRSRSIRSAAIIIPAMIHFKDVTLGLLFGAGRRSESNN